MLIKKLQFTKLVNENNESFNFGVLNGVRGFFTNPSRADDSFVPFNFSYMFLSECMSGNGYKFIRSRALDVKNNSTQANHDHSTSVTASMSKSSTIDGVGTITMNTSGSTHTSTFKALRDCVVYVVVSEKMKKMNANETIKVSGNLIVFIY